MCTTTTTQFKNSSVMNRLHEETRKSDHIHQHAAIITKNSKKPVCVQHNTKRTKFHVSSTPIINCSMHAEIAALRKLLKRVLKPRKQKYCVL